MSDAPAVSDEDLSRASEASSWLSSYEAGLEAADTSQPRHQRGPGPEDTTGEWVVKT